MTQQLFLSQPIRGVEGRYVKQAACGAFAIVVVDFEPVAWGGFELAIASDVSLVFTAGDEDHRVVFGCVDALAEGIAEELGTRTDLEVRVKVILRRMVFHAVDSNEMSFRQAGRRAARAALERF